MDLFFSGSGLVHFPSCGLCFVLGDLSFLQLHKDVLLFISVMFFFFEKKKVVSWDVVPVKLSDPARISGHVHRLLFFFLSFIISFFFVLVPFVWWKIRHFLFRIELLYL